MLFVQRVTHAREACRLAHPVRERSAMHLPGYRQHCGASSFRLAARTPVGRKLGPSRSIAAPGGPPAFGADALRGAANLAPLDRKATLPTLSDPTLSPDKNAGARLHA
jgi:hypothetical protein